MILPRFQGRRALSRTAGRGGHHTVFRRDGRESGCGGQGRLSCRRVFSFCTSMRLIWFASVGLRVGGSHDLDNVSLDSISTWANMCTAVEHVA